MLLRFLLVSFEGENILLNLDVEENGIRMTFKVS